ncbi:MAG: LptF/LptG family permease [Candidatus Omnitrophica bacterium]|jgi:lipopolysaccharide export system permease protein|nr:LptF/LptG family permease [Candidatus Omnitrophota bacterium]MDD5079681.1 LptF/LptG family permease [Candidatus Omnitrophota bacterium]
MRILDRYIFKSVLTLFLWCLFTFFFLFIIVDLFSHLDVILENRVNLRVIIQYYLAYIPVIFIQVAPFACLLATLYTFSKLNHDNEIIAMRASGLSIFQITRTVIIFGLVTSALLFWVNDRFVPQARFITERTKEAMENSSKNNARKELEVIKELSIYGMQNRLYFINKFYPATNTMTGIIILEHDSQQNITKKIVANKGIYADGIWKFYQSLTYTFDEDGQLTIDPQYLDEEVMAISETPAEFIHQRQSTDYMSIADIRGYIKRLSKSGAVTVIRNLYVDLYQRFTSPLTSMIIILLGIPFSLKIRRKATGFSSLGLSLVMGFLYYVLNAISVALGKAGILQPIIAASLPHILALTFAIYLIRAIP